MLLWKLADGKITQFHIFFLKKKVNSFPKLLPKLHPVFLPAAHLLTKIKSFKSSLDFLNNVMKKSDLLREHWFFLKTNTSLLLNHSFSKGKEKLRDAPFSLSHSLERTMKRTGTNPRLCTTHPLDWNHCPHRTRDNAKRHNATPHLRWELTGRWSQGKPSKWLCCVMTGLLLLFNSC